MTESTSMGFSSASAPASTGGAAVAFYTTEIRELLDHLVPDLREGRVNPLPAGLTDWMEITRFFGRKNFTVGLEGTNEVLARDCWPPATGAEIGTILAHHLQLVFFLGKASGVKEEVLSRELLVSVLVHGTTEEGDRRLQPDGGQGLVFRKPGEPSFQGMISLLAEKTAWELTKARIVRFCPVVAAEVLAAWGLLSTLEVAQRAKDLLTKNLRVEETPATTSSGAERRRFSPSEKNALCDLEKVRILINLLKDDHLDDDRKTVMMKPFLDELTLPEEDAHRLKKKMADSKPFKVEYPLFLQNSWRKLDLMLDLIGLALSDQKMTPDKTRFLMEAGRALGYPTEELDWLMEEEVRAKSLRTRMLFP